MKFILIGSSSMLGRRLRSRLQSNHTILCLGRDGSADQQFDLLDTAGSLPPTGDADVLIHCAANFAGNTSKELVTNERINSVGALRAGEIALAARCRHVLYISTISIYDRPENQNFGSYGLSKRHGQENLDLLCRLNGMAFTALVLSQLYDDIGEARKHQPFFYHMTDCAKTGLPLRINGRNDPHRNYLFVDDVVTIVDRIIQSGLTGVFDCPHPQSYRVSEVARLAFDVFGMGGGFSFDEARSDLPTIWIPPVGDLFDKIAYYPTTNLRQGLELIRAAQ